MFLHCSRRYLQPRARVSNMKVDTYLQETQRATHHRLIPDRHLQKLRGPVAAARLRLKHKELYPQGAVQKHQQQDQTAVNHHLAVLVVQEEEDQTGTTQAATAQTIHHQVGAAQVWAQGQGSV